MKFFAIVLASASLFLLSCEDLVSVDSKSAAAKTYTREDYIGRWVSFSYTDEGEKLLRTVNLKSDGSVFVRLTGDENSMLTGSGTWDEKRFTLNVDSARGLDPADEPSSVSIELYQSYIDEAPELLMTSDDDPTEQVSYFKSIHRGEHPAYLQNTQWREVRMENTDQEVDVYFNYDSTDLFLSRILTFKEDHLIQSDINYTYQYADVSLYFWGVETASAVGAEADSLIQTLYYNSAGIPYTSIWLSGDTLKTGFYGVGGNTGQIFVTRSYLPFEGDIPFITN